MVRSSSWDRTGRALAPRWLLFSAAFLGILSTISGQSTRVALTTDTRSTSLETEVAIRGTVQSDDGAPIAGAVCEVFDDIYDVKLCRLRGTATSGRSGQFSIASEMLGLADYCVLRVTHSDYAAKRVQVDIKRSRGVVNIVLSNGVTISGSVRDETGAPLSNVRIEVRDPGSRYLPQDPLGFVDRETETDAQGNFRTLHVGEGRRAVRASISGFATGSELVTIGSPSQTTEVNLTLRPGVSMSGRVTDVVTGRPIPNCWIWALPTKTETPNPEWVTLAAQTRSDGSYVIEGAQLRKYDLKLKPEGYLVHQNDYMAWPGQTVEAPARQVDFALKPSARIRGRVVDDVTGEPVVRFRAGPAWGEDEVFLPGDHAEFAPPVSVDGHFEIGDMYIYGCIFATAPGYAGGRSRGFKLRPGEVREVEVRLLRGSVIRGRLLDPDGLPVVDAMVESDVPSEPRSQHRLNKTFHSYRNYAPWDISGPDGSFRIAHLMPGDYMLSVVHPDFAPHETGRIAVDGRVDLQFDPITLAWGARVGGHVRLADGTPDRKAMIAVWRHVEHGSSRTNQLKDPDAPERMWATKTQSDAQGRYEVTGLRPGSYHVDITKRDGVAIPWKGRIVTLRARQVQEVDF